MGVGERVAGNRTRPAQTLTTEYLPRPQEHGAAGVIIYSDPADDGWRRGDKYPDGPWRPDTGVHPSCCNFGSIDAFHSADAAG